MGTDIYMYAERRLGDTWTLCELPTAERYVALPEELPEGFLLPTRIYNTRNYSLFAILAGVRNDAFSHRPYDVLARPRGLPPDLSGTLREWAERFGEMDDASWLLLGELEAFPWRDRRIKKEAMVDRAVAHRFGDGEGPFPSDVHSYSYWKRDGVTVTWIETYADSAGDEFLVDVLTKLRQWGGPNDVRIVFWFSS
jgi:hypothetical protein